MGSCSSKKNSSKHSSQCEQQSPYGESTTRATWIRKYTQQPLDRVVQKYNPNCLQYQYNVEVEGVVFDVIAPPDLLDDDQVLPMPDEE